MNFEFFLIFQKSKLLPNDDNFLNSCFLGSTVFLLSWTSSPGPEFEKDDDIASNASALAGVASTYQRSDLKKTARITQS